MEVLIWINTVAILFALVVEEAETTEMEGEDSQRSTKEELSLCLFLSPLRSTSVRALMG
jgi:hypothetical protein